MAIDPRHAVPSKDAARDESDPAGEAVGWQITGNLLATALIGGGAGYGLDRLFGTHFIVGIGLVASMALTLYYVWLRYGTH